MLLNFQEYGRGRPVIILHGLFGSARNWQGIARSLGSSHYIITPDLRNHGQSPHVDDMSYIEMANDVITIIDKLNLEDVILIGHSMGGKAAMTAALNYPDRFSALVVVDIAPVDYEHNFSTLVDAMNSLSLHTLKSRTEAETELKKTINELGVIQFILQNLVRAGDSFQWRLNLEGITNNLDSLLEFPKELEGFSCRLPTFFLGGAESDYILSNHNPSIFQYFPAAEITMVDGAGHWVHAEKPKEFLKEINTFINCV